MRWAQRLKREFRIGDGRGFACGGDPAGEIEQGERPAPR